MSDVLITLLVLLAILSFWALLRWLHIRRRRKAWASMYSAKLDAMAPADRWIALLALSEKDPKKYAYLHAYRERHKEGAINK